MKPNRLCICKHKEKAHNDYGVCAVCECQCFRPKRSAAMKVQYPRRSPEDSKRISSPG